MSPGAGFREFVVAMKEFEKSLAPNHQTVP